MPKPNTPPADEGNELAALGQVFTPPTIVDCMLTLVRNKGRVLEPACGDGAFLQHFPDALGIEIDPRFEMTEICDRVLQIGRAHV